MSYYEEILVLLMKEDESVRNHFEYLADLHEQLAVMDKAVTNEDYTNTLLTSLPVSYDSTVSSMSASMHLVLCTDSEEWYACSLYEYGSVGKQVPILEPLTLMDLPTWYL